MTPREKSLEIINKAIRQINDVLDTNDEGKINAVVFANMTRCQNVLSIGYVARKELFDLLMNGLLFHTDDDMKAMMISLNVDAAPYWILNNDHLEILYRNSRVFIDEGYHYQIWTDEPYDPPGFNCFYKMVGLYSKN